MKKVLAIALALVMVCTLALADSSSTGGAATTKTLSAKGYTVLKMDNTASNELDDVTEFKLTTTTTKVEKEDDETTTTYYADIYEINETKYSAVDAEYATLKLVKDKKVVAFLAAGEVKSSDEVSKVVKYAKGAELTCGDYDLSDMTYGDEHVDYIDNNGKLTTDVTIYEIGDEAYLAGDDDWAVLNGKFVKYGDEVQLIEHSDFEINTYVKNVPDSKVATIKCGNCGKVINVVEKVPTASVAKYTALDGALAGYFYLTADADVTATSTTTTNPDTGANDVIGVAAALAVVALVSGAAISLKK